MKYYKHLIISVIVLLLSNLVLSQEEIIKDHFRNQGFFNITKFNYIGVSDAELETFDTTNGGVVTELPTTNAHAFGLHTINGFFLSPYFSIGLGIGLDGYKNPTYNTLPLYLDFRAYLADAKSSPYAYLDYGTLLKVEGGKNNGTLLNIGIGYKFPINKKRFIIISDLGYSIKAVSNDGMSIRTSNNKTRLKGLILSIGMIF